MVMQERLYNVQDLELFIARPENADRLFELINGEIVEKMPSQLHALIANFFNAVLYLYMQNNPIGWVFSELRVKLPDESLNDVIPDIAVVLKAGRNFEQDAPLSYMPDLVVEIQSPDQSDKFMMDKAAFYVTHGAPLVWIVYPTKQLVEVFSQTERNLLTSQHTLEGGNVLPGFRLPVNDIFKSS
ncbi:MAG: Uma2 family endonuclease [Anaerolineae bacterium]